MAGKNSAPSVKVLLGWPWENYHAAEAQLPAYIQDATAQVARIKGVRLIGPTGGILPRVGVAYAEHIQRHVRECDLFVPVFVGDSNDLGFRTGAALYQYKKWVLAMFRQESSINPRDIATCSHPKLFHQTFSTWGDMALKIEGTIEHVSGLKKIRDRALRR